MPLTFFCIEMEVQKIYEYRYGDKTIVVKRTWSNSGSTARKRIIIEHRLVVLHAGDRIHVLGDVIVQCLALACSRTAVAPRAFHNNAEEAPQRLWQEERAAQFA